MINIYFEVGVEGANKAGKRGDVCIIVDVLRASTSIIAAMMGGYQSIKLYSELVNIPESAIVAGEMGGKKAPGCHFGNSPVELMNNKNNYRELLLFSTNGTPCINACINDSTIVLVGAIVNANAVSATALKLAQQYQKDISIILAGYHGKLEDDDLLAGSIIYNKHLFPFSLVSSIQLIESNNIHHDLLNSTAGLRLVKIGHENDIAFCAQEDITDIVPAYNKLSNHLHCFDQDIYLRGDNYE